MYTFSVWIVSVKLGFKIMVFRVFLDFTKDDLSENYSIQHQM